MNPRPKVGAVGRSLSILNPRGQADFDGVSFPVEVLGGVIDAGRLVVMTGFDPWALFVREVVSESTVPSAPVPEPVAVTNRGTQDSPDPPPAELPGFPLTNVSSLEARTIVEVLAPIQVHLQIQRGNQTTQTATVMIALTPEALWIQDAWQTRSIPLHPLDVEFRPHDNELVLTVGSDGLAEKLTLTFSRAATGEQWYREVKAKQEQLSPDVLQEVRYQPEGVTLVQQTASVTLVILESVEFTGPTAREANRGLQLRAGMRGGDAVMHVHRLKVPREGPTALSVSGVAIRVENPEDRKRLRFTWYDEELRRLFRHMLLLLILQALTILSCVAISSGTPGLNTPTGLSPSQTLASAALGIGLLHGWPLVLLILMRMLRWPQLLRGAGLAVLAATTGRSLVVWVAHLMAGGSLTILIDPILWIFVIVGLVLCIRVWQVAEDANAILPPESGTVAKTRSAWAGGLLTVTILYALGFLGVVGYTRYQTSAHLMTPGVDPRREQEALLALNEGAEQANRGDLTAAEQSMQRSLRLWEELTRSGSAPVYYRANLATTLSNLGWIRFQQGRQEEAETFYARAVALADKVGDDPSLNNEFIQTMAGARETLSELRSGKSSKALEEKDQAGDRKYEEAQVKSSKGELVAERLFQEAIALWEEVLPQATSRAYRNDAHIRLATAYLRLGTFQHNLGKLNEAEATLKKAIEHGEKAVNLNPDRPLPRHNLEVAQQTLDGLREQVLQGEISKLIREERYDAALGRYLKGIQEQEDSLRTSSDREAATRRLTYRLDRCAWFLAHCPDGRVRDTKAAIKHASRATLLQPEWSDYWYTLALVQYRNGDSRESLETLEKLKAKEGVLDATGWYLVAMNRHQLGQKKEAQGALRRATEWVSDQRRKAEGNALLRYQFELTWPYIEALKQEAEKLIEGKEAVKQGVG